MRSKTPGQNGAATRQSDGRELAEKEPSSTCANDVMATAQRRDKLALLPLKLLRFTDVRERTGLSRSTVWRLERRGAFPKHIKVSANIVAWLEEDVIEWIQSKAKGLVA
jgi:prophage regulatory protein